MDEIHGYQGFHGHFVNYLVASVEVHPLVCSRCCEICNTESNQSWTKSDQVRSNQSILGQIRSTQIILGQIRSTQIILGQIRSN